MADKTILELEIHFRGNLKYTYITYINMSGIFRNLKHEIHTSHNSNNGHRWRENSSFFSFMFKFYFLYTWKRDAKEIWFHLDSQNEYSLTSILVLLLRLISVCHTVTLIENSTDDFKIKFFLHLLNKEQW